MSRWRLNSPDASDMGPFKLPEGASIEFSKFSQLTRAFRGLTCSLPVEIQLKPFLFLQPELTFTQKGARFISSYTVPPFYTSTPVLDIRTGYRAERISRYVYNYLEVPVIAKVRFRHNRYILDMAAGPYLGLALNGKLRIKDDITFYDGSKTTDKWSEDLSFIRLEYSRTDWGANVGAMLGYEIGKSTLYLDCRYQHGLQNITTRKTMFARYFPDRFNRGVNLSLLYLLSIGEGKN